MFTGPNDIDVKVQDTKFRKLLRDIEAEIKRMNHEDIFSLKIDLDFKMSDFPQSVWTGIKSDYQAAGWESLEVHQDVTGNRTIVILKKPAIEETKE